jgi:hypothetical protein
MIIKECQKAKIEENDKKIIPRFPDRFAAVTIQD